jgi:molybdate transport system permease protein
VWPALRLSLLTTAVSLALVVALGTPLAWMLASSHGRLARAVETIVELPIVIPPAVAGVAMLLAFGRRGLLAPLLTGHSLAFTTAAVVMAEVFVSAPFYVQAATSAFRRVDPDLLVVARTFGASPLRVLFRVAIPIAAPGLAAGAAMSWARSLGEFGATLMFAGNLEGRTQTLPLAIYTALESDLRAAQALSVILVVVAFGLLLLMRALLRRKEPR